MTVPRGRGSLSEPHSTDSPLVLPMEGEHTAMHLRCRGAHEAHEGGADQGPRGQAPIGERVGPGGDGAGAALHVDQGRWAGAEAMTTTRRRRLDRKSTPLNSSHGYISYAVFCLKKKKKTHATAICFLQTHQPSNITHAHLLIPSRVRHAYYTTHSYCPSFSSSCGIPRLHTCLTT